MKILIYLCLIALAGCSDFSGLKKNLEASKYNYIKLQGTVSGDIANSETVIVLAIGPLGINDIQTYRVLQGAGDFELTALRSVQKIVAFKDSNYDYLRQKNEPVAVFEFSEKGSQQINKNINLTLALSQSDDIAPTISTYSLGNTTLDGIRVNFGTQSRIDSETFSSANIDLGMWRPLDFLKQGLAGVYQIGAPRNSDNAVLFVHGLLGSPADLSTLITSIEGENQNKYVYFYPSGMDVLDAGKALHGILTEMYARGGFKKLSIVAHSMGGLVSKAFVNACVKRQDCLYLNSLVTIASPFGGDSAAVLGVNHAPVVPPVWRSMLPEGEFISSLFEQGSLPEIKHFLVFAYRNSSIVSTRSGDGTVPLDRQLPMIAQKQAYEIRGFNANHTEILSNQEFISYINQIVR